VAPVVGDLVAHLARFAGALREHGVAVTLQDEADALAALTLVDLGDRAEVRRGLAIALKMRPADAALFAELFERWWRREPLDEAARRRRPHPAVTAPGRPPNAPRALPFATAAPAAPPSARGPGEREPGWSREAVLRRKPFDALAGDELAAMERLLARLARRLATRPSRRRVPVRGRGEVDLRRSFRRSLGSGGEPLSLARRRRAIERPRIVALLDTSGSMDPHARFLLAFLLGLRGAAPGSEVFAFNTALVRLTPWLRAGRAEAVLARLAGAVPDWSGGTRIGECLAELVERHHERIDGRTVVLVLSDGLDRGEVAPVVPAMAALARRARRVIWLNPLAGGAGYEPTARAMAAALPYVDHLLPAHDLASLERLLPLVSA
ncbi:MAG TPA: VWA domain-containing protein, partial [Thermoanaerobaculia bacterium]